jgi:hypothetical protein
MGGGCEGRGVAVVGCCVFCRLMNTVPGASGSYPGRKPQEGATVTHTEVLFLSFTPLWQHRQEASGRHPAFMEVRGR